MSRFTSPRTRSSSSSTRRSASTGGSAPYDIDAVARPRAMLAAQGSSASATATRCSTALERVEAELDAGEFVFREGRRGHPHGDRAAADRDRRPGRRQAAHGALAQRPGRDRHGDVRARARADDARARCSALQSVLVQVADAHLDWPMPGYTHLQRAPARLPRRTTCSPTSGCSGATRGGSSSCSARPSDLPLGAGALAGVNFDTDRAMVARELGFAGVAPNSIDAVSNRDFVLDFLGAAATCATHLSRLGAEIVLWSSEEFGFCEVSDAWASGSSIMPQKKNPDAAELLRAKAPRVVAAPDGAPRRAARPAADLQQGHAGGQGAPVRRGRHARPLPAGGDRDARGDHVPTATGWPRAASDEMIAADRRRRPARAPRRAVPRSRTASSPGSCARRSTPGARCPS